MPKTFTDLKRHVLNGETMGTRWSALFHKPVEFDAAPVAAAMAAAVAEVDQQMSTWKPDSDLMRLNSAPPGIWVRLPEHLMVVLAMAISVERASGGAFDIGVGDAVSAWGFGPAQHCLNTGVRRTTYWNSICPGGARARVHRLRWTCRGLQRGTGWIV